MPDKKLPADVERRFNEKFPGRVATLNHVDKLIVKLYGVPFVSRCIEPFVIIDREEARQFLADELAKARGELLLELLQVFNDYDVPLTMTAEQVRDILEEEITKKD